MDAEKQVLEVLDGVVEAWNAGDAAAYGRLFTEDATYVTFFGVNMPGRAAIEAGHRALFEGPLKGSKLAGGGKPEIRFVRPGVALVLSGGGRSLGGESGPASMVSYVLVKEDVGWLITAFQNTRVSDPRATS
jgi:uncharacterized protein (TIGR02246 family)